MSKKHNAPQFELPIAWEAGEPFALVQETTVDGARITAEQAARDRARAVAGRNQTGLVLGDKNAQRP